jgi:hypothetical protein
MDLTSRTWRKSSYSSASSDNCVEVADAARAVDVRDSKDPNGSRLAIPAADWRTFVSRVQRDH